MAKTKKKPREPSVRDFINRDFMGMKDEELDKFDDAILKLMANATKDLDEAPSKINDRYLTDDVIETVGDDANENQ